MASQGSQAQLDSPLLRQLQAQLADAQKNKTMTTAQTGWGDDTQQTQVPVAQSILQQLTGETQRLQAEADLKAQGRNADGSYVRPEFESLIDPATGMLKDQYQIGKDYKQVDLNTQGLEAFRKDATRDAGTDSAWAKLQLQKQAQDQATAVNAAAATANSHSQGLMDNLAAQGGVTGGARERMARGSLRDLMRGRQEISNQGIGQRIGIQTQDETNRIGQLKDLQGMDTSAAEYNRGNEEAKVKLQQTNVGNALAEVQNKRSDDMQAWSKNMEVWGAGKSADAQSKANSGGGGCCFIFLEARYGNGTMDQVVRRFRDEHMTERNKRGYYKLSEVLVPLMRKSRFVKALVRLSMTSPLVAYGKYHYGENKYGVVFKPVKNFWMKTFNFLGQDHEFVRENGEVI